MNRKFLTAYAAWLSFVLVCTAIAAAWYKHVEQIGWRELASQLNPDDEPSDNG